jgi:hypothetical protein
MRIIHVTQTQGLAKQLADVMSQREAEMKDKEAAVVRIIIDVHPQS